MKKRWNRMFAVILAAAGITLSCTAPAAAYVNEAAQQETEEAAAPLAEKKEAEGPLEEETPEQSEATPFSMPGNGRLLDDVKEDGTKQFLSVQTKNGNTFYIVVDRSGNTENVYMLSLVDENDLAEFMEAGSEKEPDGEDNVQPVLDLETFADTETEGGQEEDDEKTKESSGMGAVLPVLLVFGCGAVGLYYFKILRPGKVTDTEEDEKLEFYSEYETGQEEDGNGE